MNKFEFYNIDKKYGFYNSILKKLSSKNNDVFTKESKKDKTKHIKRILVDLGHENGFKVYANGFNENEIEEISKHKKFKNGKKFVNKEWLYDLHWYTDVKNTNYIPERFVLACECEWAKGKKPSLNQTLKDVGYDFQKLLFCNAEERLLITRISKVSYLEELSNYFTDAIQLFQNLTEKSKFMIVCFCLENNKIYVLEIIK